MTGESNDTDSQSEQNTESNTEPTSEIKKTESSTKDSGSITPQEAPKPIAPYINVALTRKKIPWWAASILLILPIWAIIYVGTLERPSVESTGILATGAEVYENRCSSCHGSNGGGGAGYQLSDGEVLLTFPQFQDQVEWVVKGSEGFGIGSTYGDPNRGRVVQGGMPAFGEVITAEELIGAILHERVRLSNSESDQLLAEALDHAIEMGDVDLSGYMNPTTITPQLVLEMLDGVEKHSNGEMLAG